MFIDDPEDVFKAVYQSAIAAGLSPARAEIMAEYARTDRYEACKELTAAMVGKMDPLISRTGDTVFFRRGVHKNKRLNEVIASKPGYITWLLSKDCRLSHAEKSILEDAVERIRSRKHKPISELQSCSPAPSVVP